jgi:maltose alpha-D-glucosyltransferase/alpha-amylase
MINVMRFWLDMGIDGFRVDAVPYLFEEEGTNCENLPKTHSIVKFFRAILDYLVPGSVLLAEACQPPLEVVQYFGADGDECQVAYHFPLMPRMFLTMAKADRSHIINTLDTSVTPAILDTCQWFIFLRVHDELTLEMVTEEERAAIYGYYCRDPRWDFRQSEGVSARLADLLERNPLRISLAYSIMLTLLGTPIIFYGDEFGKPNDEDYYMEMYKKTNIPDSRYFVRGRINWEQTEKDLQDPASYAYRVHQIVRSLILARKKHKAFARGTLEFVNVMDSSGQVTPKVLAYVRSYWKESVFVMNNLSNEELEVSFKFPSSIEFVDNMYTDLLGETVAFKQGSDALEGQMVVRLPPYKHYWFLLNQYP